MGKKVKCAQCGKAAAVFVSLVKDAAVSRVAYCRVHADEKGIFCAGAYDFLASEEGEKSGKITIPVVRADDLECPTCRLSQTEFERTGRFGCGDCYGAFSSALKPVLRRMHTSDRHKGKIPQRTVVYNQMRDRMRDLESKIEEAVANERYEAAAVCRDQLSELSHASQSRSRVKPQGS